MRSIIYVRQSEDKTGDGLAVQRQETECRRLADYRGWDIQEVITDNDRSASIGVRPGYERLKGLIERGEVDVVVVLRVDRLLRKIVDLEELIELTERTGVKIATVEGDLQLDSASGRLLGRILASVARAEIETKTARQKLAYRQMAEAGKSHGPWRPFGYTQGGMNIVEDEALVLKDMAHRFLNGWSYRAIALHLNKLGIITTTGKQFWPITVRNMLLNPRYAGIREYEGEQFKGAWPAVWDEDTHARILHKQKERRESRGWKPISKKHLLTGIATCGVCGAYLNGETNRDGAGKTLRGVYSCRTNHCVSRAVIPLEHFIRELIVYRLSSPQMMERLVAGGGASSAALLNKREALKARLNSLVDDYTDETLGKDEFLRAKKRTQSALDDVDEQLAVVNSSSALQGLLGAADRIRERWESEDTGWKRQVIELLMESIVVHKGKTGPKYLIDGVSYRFDPSLIDITWRV